LRSAAQGMRMKRVGKRLMTAAIDIGLHGVRGSSKVFGAQGYGAALFGSGHTVFTGLGFSSVLAVGGAT
jgi:hypothetical protein